MHENNKQFVNKMDTEREKNNKLDANSRILQPSLIVKLLERGHVAMVIRLAKKEFKVNHAASNSISTESNHINPGMNPEDKFLKYT